MQLLHFYWVVKALTEEYFYMKCYQQMYLGQSFHMPIKLQKIAVNS